MITEAGIIGKIGLNTAGVGICLNAIRARGVDYGRLPVHLAMRAVLESTSRVEAIQRLEKSGVAAAVHFLIGDKSGSTSLEASHKDLVKLEMQSGRICHSNHFIADHTEGVFDTVFSQDSLERIDRATDLLNQAATKRQTPTVEMIEEMLEDEQGLPGAINRAASGKSTTATLFGIVMDLDKKIGKARIGRPTQCKGSVVLDPTGM